MGLFHFLIVIQGIIAVALVGIILMQRSEGGGLGTGGSPSGLVSARGAADFMTRTTTILATGFVLMAITLAFVAAKQSGSGSTLDESLKRVAPAAAPAAPGQTAPADGKAAAATPAAEAPAKGEAPKKASGDVPLDK